MQGIIREDLDLSVLYSNKMLMLKDLLLTLNKQQLCALQGTAKEDLHFLELYNDRDRIVLPDSCARP